MLSKGAFLLDLHIRRPEAPHDHVQRAVGSVMLTMVHHTITCKWILAANACLSVLLSCVFYTTSCYEPSGLELSVFMCCCHCRCGPCKVMLPLLVKLQEEQPDIKVYKLNCNKKNKELGVKLGVKVAPTFQLYKNKNKVCLRLIAESG